MRLEEACMAKTVRVRLIKEHVPGQDGAFPLIGRPLMPGLEGRLIAVMESEWAHIEHYATVFFDGRSVGITLPLSYLEKVV